MRTVRTALLPPWPGMLLAWGFAVRRELRIGAARSLSEERRGRAL